MLRRALIVAVLAAGACRSHGPAGSQAARASGSPESAGVPSSSTAPTPVLRFQDLLENGKRSLVPTKTLTNANGKRVRIVGHMAQMEIPPADGFILVPRPVHCDEAGGGTADLPPDAIHVVIPKGAAAMPFVPGAIEVEGRIELGRKEHADHRVSQIRLILGGESAPSAPTAQTATATL